MEDKSAYRRILKGTAVFGGVQIFQILITLIRGKITALLIGAQGYGVSSLYTSSLAMVITLVGMGCTVSAVKYIAEQSRDDFDYYIKIHAIEKLFVFIAAAGMITTILLSYCLSEIVFSSIEYCIDFCILSVYVLANIYSSGGYAIFQGMQDLKSVAYGNVIPSFGGLLISIPLYYFWGLDAIVPVLLVVPLFSAMYIYYSLRKLYKRKCFTQTVYKVIRLREIFKDLYSTGITAMMPNLLTSGCVLLLNTFISHMGKVSDIGFYNAGMSITNQYVGLIFSAMAMDYLPRLSAAINDAIKTNKVVNEQAEIILILAFPLLSIMMLTAPAIIKILLSDEFYIIIDFIRILAFGTIIKATAWCLSYMAFAKGEKRVYLLMELWSNVLLLFMNIAGYYFDGLHGLAISYWVIYLYYLISFLILVSKRYQYEISKSVSKLFVLSLLSLLGLYLILSIETIVTYLISAAVVTLICVFCFKELNSRIGFIARFK